MPGEGREGVPGRGKSVCKSLEVWHFLGTATCCVFWECTIWKERRGEGGARDGGEGELGPDPENGEPKPEGDMLATVCRL